MSDKLQRRLTEIVATLEDKMEAITTLPTLIQQISAMEPQLKKISAAATAIATMSKWDVEGPKTMVGNVKQAVEASCTGTRDAMAALLKDMMAAHLKQVHDRFASARETAAEHYQKLQAANAEGSAVMKSHTSLLSSLRAKQTEFEEIRTNYRKHIDELAGNIQGVEERLTDLQDRQQRVLDRLEAVLEILQGLRESTPRVPYRAPPTAPSGEAVPLRIDEFFSAAGSGQPTLFAPSTAMQSRQTTLDPTALMHMAEALRLLTQPQALSA